MCISRIGLIFDFGVSLYIFAIYVFPGVLGSLMVLLCYFSVAE